ncbi:MAG: hypothetical protein ABL963_14365 [Longimicrobiales bacterium]
MATKTGNLGRYALAGLLWGGLTILLAGRAFGDSIVGGVLASPLIGLLVGSTMHRLFLSDSAWRRAWVSLASLYLGAVLFGASIGVYDWVRTGFDLGPEVVWQGAVAALYGTTLFLIGLWPLAYVTHMALATDIRWWRRP